MFHGGEPGVLFRLCTDSYILYIPLKILCCWSVVCCRNVIVSLIVLLVTVRVNCPYVLQQAHLISVLQGQNPGSGCVDGLCCLCLQIFRFLLV